MTELINILTKPELHLPRKYDDFSGKYFNLFLKNDLWKGFYTLTAESNFFSSDEQWKINQLISSIEHAVEAYLNGYPADAYKMISEGLAAIKNDLFELSNYLIEFDRDLSLYRMRVGSNHKIEATGMFHIPFELRGKAGTQRYSIPGLPSLYLGSSTYICWEELSRPDLNIVNTSLFKSTRRLLYIHFGYPPNIFAELVQRKYNGTNRDSIINIIKQYIMLWPLIAACSVKVKNRADSFKPEYIVPQLLLQWITKQTELDGVCYFSVNVEHTVDNIELNQNFVFPVKHVKEEGFCRKLAASFELTDSVPWQIFQIENTGRIFVGEPNFHRKTKLSDNLQTYDFTAFGFLEKYLQDCTLRSIKF